MSNPDVVSFIQDHYLATRKNLMTYEGRQLSQRLGSPYPGSLLIFSSESKVLEHIQETLTPEELLALLQFHAGKSSSPPFKAPSSLSSEEFPTEMHQELTERPTYTQGIPHSRRREDPFARQSPKNSSRYLSARIQEKQYDWYENSLPQEPPSTHTGSSYSYGINRNKNLVYRDDRSTSQILHKKYYGQQSLRKAIKYLKEKGVRDITVFPQGRTLQGEPIYILRYSKKAPKNKENSRVKLYRPTPYQGF